MNKWQIMGALSAFLLVASVQAATPSRLLPPLPQVSSQKDYVPVTVTPPQAVVAEPTEKAEVKTDNSISKVYAIDFMTVEVTLAKPLPEHLLNPQAVAETAARFHFSDEVRVVSAPMPLEGEKNVYRLRVDGLQPASLYTVRYEDSKEVTFKTYATQKDMSEAYKNRFGDHF